jgi:transcriptional regulator with XRE-family HTH domain
MITADELQRMKAELERLPAVIADARQEMREQRELRRISVRTAAEAMAVPPTTLSRFEKGVGTPTVGTLLAVLDWIAVASDRPGEDVDVSH